MKNQAEPLQNRLRWQITLSDDKPFSLETGRSVSKQTLFKGVAGINKSSEKKSKHRTGMYNRYLQIFLFYDMIFQGMGSDTYLFLYTTKCGILSNFLSMWREALYWDLFCRALVEECGQDFVDRFAPGAKYVGMRKSRIHIPASGSQPAREVERNNVIEASMAGQHFLIDIEFVWHGSDNQASTSEVDAASSERQDMTLEEILKESGVYEKMVSASFAKGLEQGRLEEAHQSIGELVDDRFPALLAWVKVEVEKVSDLEALRKILRAVSRATTAEEIKAAFA
ncbi:MAG TPA: hypothetical protein VGD98_11835 [Ktedonobacteraceae bacterium]